VSSNSIPIVSTQEVPMKCKICDIGSGELQAVGRLLIPGPKLSLRHLGWGNRICTESVQKVPSARRHRLMMFPKLLEKKTTVSEEFSYLRHIAEVTKQR